MPHTISFCPSLLDSHCIIDVRSPLEFAEDHLPGAFNVPLLENHEREEVGTIYKQVGSQAARLRGLELTSSRFGEMVRRIVEQAGERPILLYCWRGGLRSQSMALLLDQCGYRAYRLAGGYKAFRGIVNGFFEMFTPLAPLLVLHGMTGSGKTEFIQSLSPDRWAVIDLEGLARHRGSAFGSLGMGAQPPQKRFDTLLWDAFRCAPPGRPIVLEGESKRIGQITLPGNLYEVMADSIKIWCETTSATRVARLGREYALEDYRQPMGDALLRIRKRLGEARYLELQELLDRWDVEQLAAKLMEYYYDKLYYRVRRWEPQATISLESYQQAEQNLAAVARSLKLMT